MEHLAFFENIKDFQNLKKIIIHPTNSCYGFGAKIYDKEAYMKIYEIKGRPISKPFFITVSSFDAIEGIGIYDSRMNLYINKYPSKTFTFIIKRSPDLPAYINVGFDTIGVQIASGLLQKVCGLLGGSMFGTSANFAGEQPIYESNKIKETFNNYDDLTFLDAGNLEYQEPSTIIDLTLDIERVIRGSL